MLKERELRLTEPRVASPSTSNVKKHQAKGSRENGDGRRVDGWIHTEMFRQPVTFYPHSGW